MVALGVFLSGAGVLAALVLAGRDNRGIEIIDSGSTAGMTEGAGMTVDVAGAVIHPGVYRLPPGSRFTDALAAAGGLSASADRNWVSRHLNLAQNITDGIKIYILGVGENTANNTSSTSTTGNTDSANITNPISINNASLSDLDTLWGVGESRAQAIVAGRPYGSIEELVTRKILPGNVVERNRDKLSL